MTRTTWKLLECLSPEDIAKLRKMYGLKRELPVEIESSEELKELMEEKPHIHKRGKKW